jgi:hypothetical protein
MLNKIFNSKWFRFLITISFIYFLYVNSKEDKQSISNALNKENLQEGIEILSSAVENYNYYNNQKNINLNKTNNINQDNLQLKIKDYNNSTLNNLNSPKSKCQDKLKLEVAIYNNKQELIQKEQIEIILGSKQNLFLEQIASNLSVENWRLVEIPIGYKTNNPKIDNLLQSNMLEYRIVILDLIPNFSAEIICN